MRVSLRGVVEVALAALLVLGVLLLGLWSRQPLPALPHAAALAPAAEPTPTGPSLVIAVLSSPTGQARRDVIRETWLSSDATQHVSEFEAVFVVGIAGLAEGTLQDLRAEAAAHGDLALLNVTDSYVGLASKLLATLVWVSARYPTLRHLAKVDDDTFVRVSSLQAILAGQPSSPPLYLGYFDGRAPVRRRGKWAEPKWVLSDRYLPYALGGGYVVGATAVHFIARNGHLLELYNSEDVSLGVWLAPLMVNRVHDVRFDTEWKTRGCQNKFVVMHKQTPQMMRSKWAVLRRTNGERCCEPETVLRREYQYQWNVLASQCCPGRGLN